MNMAEARALAELQRWKDAVEAEMQALRERVAQLESRRGPGRPKKNEANR